ncbi:MAG: response regulator [Armatimonadetes bacterium]|nr:response regulator [Armatimonadota bacterium]
MKRCSIVHGLWLLGGVEALLLVMAGATFWLTRQYEEQAISRMLGTMRALDLAVHTQSHAGRMSAALRGYTLARRPEFPREARQEYASFQQGLDDLSRSASFSPEQTARLGRLWQEGEYWRDQVMSPILKAGDSLPTERRIALILEGKKHIDAVHTALVDFSEEERALLIRRASEYRAQAWKAQKLMGLAVLALFIFSLFSAFLIHRSVVRPLTALTAMLDQVTGQEEPRPLEFKGVLPLEVSQMAQNFNRMRNRLAQALGSLEERNRSLREQQNELEAIIQGVGEGMLVADLNLTVRLWNPSMEQLTGIPVSDAVGKTIIELLSPHTGPGQPLTQETSASGRAIREARTVTLESTITSRSGERIPVAVTATPVRDGEEIEGAIVLCRDIRPERAIERMKTEMVNVVSHDLRTPLGAIVGFTELLLYRDLPEDKRKHYLTIMHREAIRLTDLVNDFLDVQRMESGRQVYDRRPVNLKHLIAGAVDVFARQSDRHSLIMEVPDGLPDIKADPDRIQQCLANLLSNAIKYSPQGGQVRIGAFTEEETGSVRVYVADQGLGIPAEAAGQLFGKFVRIQDPARQGIGGTGLGLAICKEIVEAHGGRIWLESEGPGKGSAFYFTLPVADTSRLPAADAPVDVLVVEDDPAFGEMMCGVLLEAGYHCRWVDSGGKALSLARLSPPRLVIVNINLGDRMDGWEVIAHLQEIPGLDRTAIIVSSGQDEEQRAVLHGAMDFLFKPFSQERLIAAVRKAVPDGDYRQVMVVEDDPSFLASETEILRNLNLKVAGFDNGQEAMHAIESQPPDLLVLDLVMPQPDGMAILQWMRSRPETENTPVLVVTGKDLTLQDRRSLAQRMAEVIPKRSFSPEEMARLVKELLGAASNNGPA